MSNLSQSISASSAWVNHIPVLWFEPPTLRPVRQLIIFLPNLSGTKERMTPFLQDLAAAGICRAQF